MIRGGTRRRLVTYLWILLGSVLAGMIFGWLVGLLLDRPALLGIGTGAVHAVFMGGILGALEIFGARTRVGQAVERAPFLVTFAVKSVVYGAVIGLVEAATPGARVFGVPPAYPMRSPLGLLTIVYSVSLTFAFLFLLQISRLVGGRTLRDIVRGRYHRPRVEDRFFLFVDIVGSTTLAERLGAAGVHRFLDRVFRVAADPIDDHRGQIYQYVGDEMVVTWTLAVGGIDARPLACFFAVETALTREGPAFARRFGVTPRLRGALHAGPVIVGEVGESKREIVFHGDVMNTASRLEQVSRDLDRRLVVSEAALERLPARAGFALEDLGMQALRGRLAPVRAFGVEARARAGGIE